MCRRRARALFLDMGASKRRSMRPSPVVGVSPELRSFARKCRMTVELEEGRNLRLDFWKIDGLPEPTSYRVLFKTLKLTR